MNDMLRRLTCVVSVFRKYWRVCRGSVQPPTMHSCFITRRGVVFSRERQVLVLVSSGLMNKQIAAELGLADRSAVSTTPVEAFFDNSYIDEIKQSGFLKELWR